jgi:hypothetical protein
MWGSSSVVVASVFFRQHDRHHAVDDGLCILLLDIWLFIQIDLEEESADSDPTPTYRAAGSRRTITQEISAQPRVASNTLTRPIDLHQKSRSAI